MFIPMLPISIAENPRPPEDAGLPPAALDLFTNKFLNVFLGLLLCFDLGGRLLKLTLVFASDFVA